VNDAGRLALDPAMRAIVGREGLDRAAASSSEMGRFETAWLATNANLEVLRDLSGSWIEARMPAARLVVDAEWLWRFQRVEHGQVPDLGLPPADLDVAALGGPGLQRRLAGGEESIAPGAQLGAESGAYPLILRFFTPWTGRSPSFSAPFCPAARTRSPRGLQGC
jgi:hypothetical protein